MGAVAWASANPFNGAVFGTLATLLLAIATRLPRRPIDLDWPLVVICGASLIVFGSTYPHFVAANSWTEYVYAAPLGLLPCPTLAVTIGITLMFGLFRVKAWSAALLAAGFLYGAIGIVRLGVILDALLVLGVAALALVVFTKAVAIRSRRAR